MKKILASFMLLLALGLSACESSSDSNNEEQQQMPEGQGELSVDRIRIISNGVDKATFAVTCEGVDVTDSSIFYQSGSSEPLEGNTFSVSVSGDYDFYATYSDLSTSTVTVTAGPTVSSVPDDPNASSTVFDHTMLLMQFTGTECTYCPTAISAIDKILESDEYSSKIEHVAIHSYKNTDPYYNIYAIGLSVYMSPAAYPGIFFDFDKSSGQYTFMSVDECYLRLTTLIDERHTSSPSVGLAAATSIRSSIISANIGVKAAVAGEYRVGMMLLENGLYAYQYGSSGIIEHANVVRAVAERAEESDYIGVSVGSLEAGESTSVILDINVDSEWELDNCHLVIYVTALDSDSGCYVVENVIRCVTEGSVAYQYQ
ncbi:MAG: Omp28-related outer membrane protein [Rikenellaceae bacterium]